jgi:hypothetical protein
MLILIHFEPKLHKLYLESKSNFIYFVRNGLLKKKMSVST